MEIYERIKLLRKDILKITQEDFANTLGISRSNVGNIEVGRINVTDRVIHDICDKYSVNKDWICSGKTPILIEDQKSVLDDLKNQYKLSDMDMSLIEIYLELPERDRHTILSFMESISGKMHNTNNERQNTIAKDILKTEMELSAALNTKDK